MSTSNFYTIKLKFILLLFSIVLCPISLFSNSTPPADSYLRDAIIQEISLTESARIDLYVMSQCPYGVKAEKFIIPILREQGEHVSFNLRFIVNETSEGGFSSLHGQPEVDENRRQLIISRHFKEQFLDYLLIRAKDYYTEDWYPAAKEAGIDVTAIETLMQDKAEIEIFRNNIKYSNLKMIFGSPSLFINGKKYIGSFSPKKKVQKKKVAADGTCMGGADDGAGCCTDFDCDSKCTNGPNQGLTGCMDNAECGACQAGDPANLGSPCLNDGACGNTCDMGHTPGMDCAADSDCMNKCVGGVNDGMPNCGNDDACNACVGGGSPGAPCLEDSNCLKGCVGGSNAGGQCTSETDCPNICQGGYDDGVEGCINSLDCRNQCVGGTNANNPCFSNFDCPGGTCPNVATCNTGSCTGTGTCQQGTCEIGTCTGPGDCATGNCEQGTCDLPLPVEMVNFNAYVLDGDIVTLRWRTLSESNNEGFEVQHSMDGNTWDALDFVEGFGTTSEVQDYTWDHKTPEVGINYYRLRQVDLDGTSKILSTKAVEILSDELVVQVFPNPSKGNSSLYLNSKNEEEVTVKIFNSNGQTVKKYKHRVELGDNIFSLEMMDLPQGIYSVIVKSKRKIIGKSQLILY